MAAVGGFGQKQSSLFLSEANASGNFDGLVAQRLFVRRNQSTSHRR